MNLFNRSQPIQFSCVKEIRDKFARIDECLGANARVLAEFERSQDEIQFFHFEQGIFFKRAFVIISVHSNQIKKITGFIKGNTGDISFLRDNYLSIDLGKNKFKKLRTYIDNSILFKTTVQGNLDTKELLYECRLNNLSYCSRYFYYGLLESSIAKSAKIRLPWRLKLRFHAYINDSTYYNIVGDNQSFLQRENYICNNDNESIVIEAYTELPEWCSSNLSLNTLSIWLESKIKQILQDNFEIQCKKLCEEFLKGLNPIALTKATEVKTELNHNSLNDVDTSRLYNWFNASGNPNKTQWRIQAYDSFPIPLLVCIDFKVKGITKTIDQGKPLLPQLEQLFSIPKTVLKDFKHLDYGYSLRIMSMMERQILFRKGMYGIDSFDLKQIAKKTWPARGRKIPMDQQWKQFFSIIDAKNQWVRTFSSTPVYSHYTCLFRDMEETMCAKPIETSDIYGVSDMMRSFTRQCLFGALYDTDHLIDWPSAVDILSNTLKGISIIEQALTKNLTPLAVMALSKEWHRRREVIEQIISSTRVATDYVWPALVSDQSTMDYQITALVSKYQLQKEGQELQHCVANYAENCALGKSAIFSIKKMARSIATLELSISQKDRLVSIKQLQGLRNSTVEPSIREVAVWLQEKINNGEIPVDWENNIENYKLATERVAEQSLIDTIGYDPNDRQIRIRVFEAWKPILPKNVRELSYDQWIASLSIEITRAKLNKQERFEGFKRIIPNTLHAFKKLKRL